MKTRKPCPGCGSVRLSRPANSVCYDCAHAIASWNKHIETAKVESDMENVYLKECYHWYPLFYFGGPSHTVDGLDETRQELGRLFSSLGDILCVDKFGLRDGIRDATTLYPIPEIREPKKKGEAYANLVPYPCSRGDHDMQGIVGKIDRRVLDVIRKLWDRTARFAEMAYLGGVQDGRNILTQLASGQLSSGDLEEKDAIIARRIQNSSRLHRRRKEIDARGKK